MKISGVVLASALLAALAGGCFSTNPDGPETRGLGNPVASTPVQGSLSVSDVAVDPGSGNLVTMGYDNVTGANGIIVIERGTGAVIDSVETTAYGSSIGMLGTGVVILSDGSWSHTRIDLGTGLTSTVNGMEDLQNRSPAYLDSGDDLDNPDDEGDVVSVECEPRAGSPIEVWGGSGTSRALVSSTPLRADVTSVTGLAYAPERDLVFAFTDRGLVAISTVTGELEMTIEGTEGLWGGLAWDSATGRLLIASQDWRTGTGLTVIDEYEL